MNTMTRSVLRTLSAFVLTLSAATVVDARVIEAEGAAPIIDGAYNAARDKAVKEAVRQAMLMTSARVDTTSVVSTNVLIIDSARVNAAGTVNDVQVLDEWTDDDTVHVRIRAEVPKEGERSPDPAARLRKKVAVVQFAVLDRRQIFDLPDFERELPREMQRRMQLSGEFVALDATQFQLAVEPVPKLQQAVVNLADRLGAQIVVAGMIRDMGVHERPLWFSTRRVEIEIVTFDGVTGVQLGRHRFSENVAKTDWFAPRANVFSNAEFMQTTYGRALDTILDRQMDLVKQDLAQLPFQARVVRVEGKKVYVDAGSAVGLSVGDMLMSFRVDPEPMLDPRTDQLLGYRETPMATVDIKQVQPFFAVGELEGNKELRIGDIVRFGGDGFTEE